MHKSIFDGGKHCHSPPGQQNCPRNPKTSLYCHVLLRGSSLLYFIVILSMYFFMVLLSKDPQTLESSYT